jgi:predicted metal-dependent HD superfamily phosphohydrolase
MGFIEQYWDNEPVGVRIAEDTLPTFGYAAGQIEVVKGLILATRFPQSPENPLEQILCDADVYNLGGEESFWIAGDRLIRERIAHCNAIPPKFQPPHSLQEWWERQCRFLEIHSYFTVAAQLSREKGKQRNLETIRQLLRMFHQKNGKPSEP